MERMELNAKTREAGKSFSKKLRREGNIPAILYGSDRKPQTLYVDFKEMNKVLATSAGWNILLDLNIDSKEKVLTRITDYQADVMKRNLTHIDFHVLDINKKLKTEVPLKLIGTPAGVKEGGILEVIRRSLEIRCLPTNIPGHIEIDVSAMEIGSNIHIDDITLPEGVECLLDTNFSIASIVAPTEEIVAEVPEEAAEGEEGAPVEGAEGEEGAAPAEGEAAADKGEKPAEKKAEEGGKKE